MQNIMPAASMAAFNSILTLAAHSHFDGSGILIFLVVVGGMGLTCYTLYFNNRLLFWCLAGAFGGHLLFAGVLYAMGIVFKPSVRKEIRIAIASVKMPPKEIPPPPKTLDLPLGALNGNPHVTKMPHGHTLKKTQSMPRDPGHIMHSGEGDDGTVHISDSPNMFIGHLDDPDVRDISNIAEQAGTPEGEGNGDVPAGFPNGKIGGRVYFIRMKQDRGSWNENDEGIRRLMTFLNGFFPCERESRAMSCAEMRARFLNQNKPPSFLYIYADDSFSLSSTDVTVLHQYIGMGGFLFIDSRPDPEIQTVVSREMDKVLPGMPMRPLSRSNTINTFLFRTSDPVVGENTVTMVNYGIMNSGRLSVFYTMGNFSHLYASHAPNELPYFTAQYQMGANVMLYAIRKGDNSGIDTRAGASAKITTEALQHLGMLETTGGAPGANRPPPVRPKATPLPTSSADEQPEEVKIVD